MLCSKKKTHKKNVCVCVSICVLSFYLSVRNIVCACVRVYVGDGKEKTSLHVSS